MPVKNDLIIPKEFINLLPNSIRVIDKKHLAGMWPVDFTHIRKLEEVLPTLFKNEAIVKKFNFAITYTGKEMKTDLPKNGIVIIEDRVVHDIWLHGIPVPWPLLKKAGIDYRKINVLFSPR